MIAFLGFGSARGKGALWDLSLRVLVFTMINCLFTLPVVNRAAEGGRGSRTAFGFLTALPKAGAVLELPSVFLNRAAVGWAVS